MELENVYIQLLEQHRELPDRDVVLARFREAFFLRLERGSARAEENASAAPAYEPTEPDAWQEEAPLEADDGAGPTPFSLDDEPAPDEEAGDLLGDLGFADQPPEEDDPN